MVDAATVAAAVAAVLHSTCDEIQTCFHCTAHSQCTHDMFGIYVLYIRAMTINVLVNSNVPMHHRFQNDDDDDQRETE